MKKKLEQPSACKDELFQQAMEGVTPIVFSNRIPPSSPKPTIQIRANQAELTKSSDFFSDHDANDIAPTSFHRSGINNMTLRKLRRAFWPVQNSIDLHGQTSEEARQSLFKFLNYALGKKMRCVNVIHGKGWRAEGGEGVLKMRVRHWLTQLPHVLAFCEPPANAGGGGAVWVLLKARSG